MTPIVWIVFGLALVDGLLLFVFYDRLRRRAPLGGQDLVSVAAGLGVFGLVGLMFFSGAILFVHLAMMGGGIIICLCLPRQEGPGTQH